MTKCKEACELFYAYLDKELSKEDLKLLGMHIEACKECFGHLEFDKAFRALLKNRSLRDNLPQEIKTLICEKLRECL